jgi:hypothetical protein
MHDQKRVWIFEGARLEKARPQHVQSGGKEKREREKERKKEGKKERDRESWENVVSSSGSSVKSHGLN